MSLQMANFEAAEYQARVRRAQHALEKYDLSGFLLCDENNYKYFTGHRTQFFVSRSRPMYVIVPRDYPPIALVAEIESAVIRQSSWLSDVRTWLGFADDSLPILVDILRETNMWGGRVGVDYGQEMRLGMPLTTFRRLEESSGNTSFVDGAPALWEVRTIKSHAEIQCVRASCAASQAGFDIASGRIRPGARERDIHREVMIGMLEGGAEQVDWLPIHSGPGNYAKFSMEPTDRILQRGEMVWIDAGTRVNGYYSDYNRVWAVGDASQSQKEFYEKIWEVTQACVDVVRPGLPIADIVASRDRAFRKIGIVETGSRSGRMGHGSGLDITEPPSVSSMDETILAPGMVIHIEPKILQPFGFFQVEEVVAVTESGHERLCVCAPERLPVCGG